MSRLSTIFALISPQAFIKNIPIHRVGGCLFGAMAFGKSYFTHKTSGFVYNVHSRVPTEIQKHNSMTFP